MLYNKNMKLTLLKNQEFEVETSEIRKSVLTLDQVNAEIALMNERQSDFESQIAMTTKSLENIKAHKKEMEDVKTEMEKLMK